MSSPAETPPSDAITQRVVCDINKLASGDVAIGEGLTLEKLYVFRPTANRYELLLPGHASILTTFDRYELQTIESAIRYLEPYFETYREFEAREDSIDELCAWAGPLVCPSNDVAASIPHPTIVVPTAPPSVRDCR